MEGAPVLQARRLQRATKTGAWLTVQPSTVNGTEIEAQECRNALFLRYGLKPLDLSTHCDGCQAKFLISHTFYCKKGGLVTARHNELRDGVSDLAGKAFTPSHVRDDLLIYSGRAVKRTKAAPSGAGGTSKHEEVQMPEVTEYKGNLLIRDLWQQETDSVHDMRVVNTDNLTHRTKGPEKCLHKAEQGEKNMHLEACLQQIWHFSPFVALVDRMMGVEATSTLKRLASRLATKWKQYYYKTCGYVKSRIAITLVHATHHCIRGSRVPTHRISFQRPQWENGVGINLFR